VKHFEVFITPFGSYESSSEDREDLQAADMVGFHLFFDISMWGVFRFVSEFY
jgi:hypothetical protein